MPLVTRADLREVLTRWERGELTHQQIYDWANERFGPHEWEVEDEVAKDVLTHLDVLDMNLTTPEDVPDFLAMLDSTREEDARRILEEHAKTFNLQERSAKWKDDPFYAPFCHPVGE